MRRQTPVAHALYTHLFPHPTPSDPPSFAAHLARNLVPEVRIEVATYYGDLNSVEARYPGLNYCHAPHRMRLGRFKHHRRLFEAFDQLGLTYQEIQDFCCWEGSRWARMKYEEDQGEKVVDTTGDEIGPEVDRRHERDASEKKESITRKTDISIIFEDAAQSEGRNQDIVDEPMLDVSSMQEDRLNVPRRSQRSSHTRRLLRHLNQRVIQAWQQGEPIPAEIEAIIKEQVENGSMDSNALNMITSVRSNARAHTASVQPSVAALNPAA